jgi:hypothetical protein
MWVSSGFPYSKRLLIHILVFSLSPFKRLRILRLGFVGPDFDLNDWLRTFLESCMPEKRRLDRITFDLPHPDTWQLIDRLLVECKPLDGTHIGINIVNGRPSLKLVTHMKDNLPLLLQRGNVSFSANSIRLFTCPTIAPKM